MSRVITAVRDLKENRFTDHVMTHPSRAAAIRDFGSATKNPDAHYLHTHPEDFQLYYLGEYDPENGNFIPCYPPELLASGDEFKE